MLIPYILHLCGAINNRSCPYYRNVIQNQNYWEQVAETQQQLEKSKQQQDLYDEILQRIIVQFDRQDEIMDRQERILEAMEKQHGLTE